MTEFVNFTVLSTSTDHSPPSMDFINALQSALFDYSKRNPNIDFKGGSAFLELGMPLSLMDLKPGYELPLNVHHDGKLIRSLDRMRVKANRNQRELGFNQLNLITHFIHWTNPKSDNDRLKTPLILVPIELLKKKGLEHVYVLKVTGEPSFNPFVFHLWHKVFQFSTSLPDFFDNDTVCSWFLDNEPKLNIHLTPPGHQDDSFTWHLNAENATLGNFDFRRMSLIQDYDAIRECSELINDLEDVSSYISSDTTQVSLQDTYNVLSSDPSQSKVVEAALAGKNIVVQGPPGTGKSQTLVNVATSLIAQGKKVLIVSEKKVALDVVHERIKQAGLGNKTLMAFHSINDRKAVIQDLKKTYQQAFHHNTDIKEIHFKRGKIQNEMDSVMLGMERYFAVLQEKDEHGISLQQLYEVGLTVKQYKPQIAEEDTIKLPNYYQFKLLEASVEGLYNLSVELGYHNDFRHHPCLALNPNLWRLNTPEISIRDLVLKGGVILSLQQVLEHLELDKEPLSAAYLLCVRAGFLKKLHHMDLLDLADTSTTKSKKYDKLVGQYRKAEKRCKKLEEKVSHWRIYPYAEEVSRAIFIIEKYQDKWYRFAVSSYRKTQKAIEKNYNLKAHAIVPDVLNILRHLQDYQNQQTQQKEILEKLKETLNIDHIDMVDAVVKDVRQKTQDNIEETAVLLDVENGKLQAIHDITTDFDQLYTLSKQLFAKATQLTFQDVHSAYLNLRGVLDELPAWAHYLSVIVESPAVYDAIKYFKVDFSGMKSLVVDKEIRQRLMLRFWLNKTTSFDIERWMSELVALDKTHLAANAEIIECLVNDELKALLHLSERPASTLSQDEKILKKKLKLSRKILEHEFGKTMRYKSLRELIDLDCIDLLLAIKPVWMMSPHSIADNLPLTALFDTIIFDEASQVKIEEGYTSFLRAKSCIVVGDEMQLPPSSFFQTQHGLDLAPSLLSHFAPKLVNHQLNWHYRSRSSALIDFSNTHFYKSSLIVVPHPKETIPPFKWCKLDEGKYINRRNEPEAHRVVQELEELLKSGEKSIAVVAFSLEQMKAIEVCLEESCWKNPALRMMLEKAYSYERDGCFEGLLIKNLENIQGDERDFVLISTGYGMDEKGFFRQHFGPVSQDGGEKRLNVLFTRAKRQIRLITSLSSQDLKSGSDGALILKQYLASIESGSILGYNKNETSEHVKELDVMGMSHGLSTGLDGSSVVVTPGTERVHALLLKTAQQSYTGYRMFAQKQWNTVCYDARTVYEKEALLSPKFAGSLAEGESTDFE